MRLHVSQDPSSSNAVYSEFWLSGFAVRNDALGITHDVLDLLSISIDVLDLLKFSTSCQSIDVLDLLSISIDVLDLSFP